MQRREMRKEERAKRAERALFVHAGGFVLLSRAVIHVVVVLLCRVYVVSAKTKRLWQNLGREDSHPSRRRPSRRRLNLPTLRCWRTSGRILQ